MTMRTRALISIVAIAFACVTPALAADNSSASGYESNAQLRKEMRAMAAQMAQMQQRMSALEARLSAPGAAAAATAQANAGATASSVAEGAPPPGVTPAGQPPPGVTVGEALKQLMPGAVNEPQAPRMAGGSGEASPSGEGVIIPGIPGVPQMYIPDISAVGDFALQQDDYKKADPRYDPSADKFTARDTQIIFFSPIDPYTNAQISIDKPNNGPFDIEEAFVVFNKLPYNLQLRVGQYRPVFGLLNETDTFQLPIVNRPNALANFITQDGFVEPGINLTAYIPNPWDADLKLDTNMLSGVNPLAFNHRNGQNFDFAYMGTLTYSRDLFSSGYMQAGGSVAGGPGPGGQAYYGDPFVQFQYAPDQRDIWTLNLEGLLTERQDVGEHGLKSGFYTMLDYNFWLRYHAGFLVDIADRPLVQSGTTAGFSPVFTYFVSDNTRLRGQYTFTTGSGPERPSNVFFLQMTFSLGNLKPLD
jgi:hypothetical protein